MWSVTPFRTSNGASRAVSPMRGALIDRVFGDSFDELFSRAFEPVADEANVAAARVDIHDKGVSFEVKADLPGVSKDDVKVTIEDDRVSIEAEVKRESEKKEGERVVYSERYASKFVRSFTLPAEVDSGKSEAKLENGVLTLSLPKKATVVAKQLIVN